jgi:hypothetical protein
MTRSAFIDTATKTKPVRVAAASACTERSELQSAIRCLPKADSRELYFEPLSVGSRIEPARNTAAGIDSRRYTSVHMADREDFSYTSTDAAEEKSVCARCFDDEHIKAFIKSTVQSRRCDFCGQKSKTREIAAPLDGVMDFILGAINREYERAVEALGWDGAEGGYQGQHWDSNELIEHIGLGLPKDDGRLQEVLVDCLGDEPWCEQDPYGPRPDEHLISSWEHFCRYIKHQRRYFFLERKRKSALGDNYLTPSDMLGFIGQSIDRVYLVRKVPTGSLIYRARQMEAGKTLRTSYDFGPPPVNLAMRSNRMSPAGIVMFYCSNSSATAVAEVDDDPKLGICVGAFRTTREANILNLTELPPPLGFFEQQPELSEISRSALAFLNRFVTSMATKVEPGQREHVEYVPTQVVTEWFRTVYHSEGGRLDGIAYPSAQRSGGSSLVLFADRYDVTLTASELKEACAAEKVEEWTVKHRHEKSWLKLVKKKIVRMPC